MFRHFDERQRAVKGQLVTAHKRGYIVGIDNSPKDNLSKDTLFKANLRQLIRWLIVCSTCQKITYKTKTYQRTTCPCSTRQETTCQRTTHQCAATHIGRLHPTLQAMFRSHLSNLNQSENHQADQNKSYNSVGGTNPASFLPFLMDL